MNVPPLVSEELWLKAQERLEMNRKFSARNANSFLSVAQFAGVRRMRKDAGGEKLGRKHSLLLHQSGQEPFARCARSQPFHSRLCH